MSPAKAFLLATMAIGASGFGPSIAAEPSGEAVSVVQSTAVSGTSGNRPLAAKGPIFTGDVVKTDEDGSAQILFRDDTKLVVGPNSEITIDRFVFADQSTASEVAIDALRGVFRFITGSSQKQAYKITTPTATIGVRGTAFDAAIENGVTYFGLWDGGVRMCERFGRRRCAELNDRCSVLILAPEEDFRWVSNIYERTNVMESVFPFAFRQSKLLNDFRVKSRACHNRERIRRDTDHERKKKCRSKCD